MMIAIWQRLVDVISPSWDNRLSGSSIEYCHGKLATKKHASLRSNRV